MSHRPRCTWIGCPGRLAVATIRWPLSKPFRERIRSEVCEPCWVKAGRMFGSEKVNNG